MAPARREAAAMIRSAVIVLALLSVGTSPAAASMRCGGTVESHGADHGMTAYAISVTGGATCAMGKYVIARLFRQMTNDVYCAIDSASAPRRAVGCEVGNYTCERPSRRGKIRGRCYHHRLDREVRFLERDY
jgi:hypothetical protein